MNSHDILSNLNIAQAIAPVDLAGGANNGDWLSMKNYDTVVALLIKKAGVAGDDPIFTLKQATKVDGTGAKPLNFSRIWKKQGADLGAITDWTIVDQTPADTYTDATSAEVAAIYAVEIRAEDLDVNGGFDCIQLSVPDVGAGGAQLGCGLYLAAGSRYGSRVNPLVD